MATQAGFLHTKEDHEAARRAEMVLRHELSRVIVSRREEIPEQRYVLEELLRRWSDEEEIDLIVSVGGTFPAPGPSDADFVPEATLGIVERLMPSLPETMRSCAAVDSPLALLDRGVAGIRGRTLILNLPGGDLTVPFLESVVDVIAPVLQRLARAANRESGASQDEREQLIPDVGAAFSHPGLNGTDFARFLEERRLISLEKDE